MAYGQYRITSGYGEPRSGLPHGIHHGLDVVFHDRKVHSPEAARVIFSGPDRGYRYDGSGRLVPYTTHAVIIEGIRYFHAFYHLTGGGMPRVGQQVNTGSFIGSHESHVHWEVHEKRSNWVSLTYGQANGWTINPLSTNLWIYPQGGDEDMIKNPDPDKGYIAHFRNIYEEIVRAMTGRVPPTEQVDRVVAENLAGTLGVRDILENVWLDPNFDAEYRRRNDEALKRDYAPQCAEDREKLKKIEEILGD